MTWDVPVTARGKIVWSHIFMRYQGGLAANSNTSLVLSVRARGV